MSGPLLLFQLESISFIFFRWCLISIFRKIIHINPVLWDQIIALFKQILIYCGNFDVLMNASQKFLLVGDLLINIRKLLGKEINLSTCQLCAPISHENLFSITEKHTRIQLTARSTQYHVVFYSTTIEYYYTWCCRVVITTLQLIISSIMQYQIDNLCDCTYMLRFYFLQINLSLDKEDRSQRHSFLFRCYILIVSN